MTVYTRAVLTADRLLKEYGSTLKVGGSQHLAVSTKINFNDLPQTLHGIATREFIVQAQAEIAVGDIVEFAGQESRVIFVAQVSPAGTTLVYRIVTSTQ